MERLDVINKRLAEHYGVDTINGLPIWRIVWSHDQVEKRLMNVTDAGIHLITPEVREVPKYRHYIHNKWVLEKLVIVPEQQQAEICTPISYEPMFVFETNNGGFLPYKWEACAFVIDTVNAAMGKSSMHAKYVDPDSGKDPQAVRNERISNLEKDLFGNETEVGDALAHGEGVAGFHSKMVN
jgi:hypothetical protein